MLHSYIEACSTNQSEVCPIELLLALGPYWLLARRRRRLLGVYPYLLKL